jgi:hypothetical protein
VSADDRDGRFGRRPDVELVARSRIYITASRWTFAKTMPTIPHWYVVRERAWAQSPEMGEGHEALFVLIRDYHYNRPWRGRHFRSIDLGDSTFWIMEDGTVINRTFTDWSA